jgi:cyanophycin synthetase
MLGHGRHQRVLDGTWSLDLGEDLAPVEGAEGDPDIELPEGAAERVLDRLFPDGEETRMPIIAVTGTNGKTTTVRMVDFIMRHAGLRRGMVCTNGTYLDGRLVDERDVCTDTGHLQVLTSKEVDIAVLEAHHTGLGTRGFCFDWCDVAVCTNVTNDHLGIGNIDTVEQMAELKQSLPLRARKAAVLNADDQHCLGMAARVTAERVCLVSMSKSAGELQCATTADVTACCVLEHQADREWLVIHDRQRRIPVVAVNAIPATFNGTARFNVSNAMHAALSSYMLGVEPAKIAAALGDFTSSIELAPGRLNIFDGLPFRVLMDYAHNVDGYTRLVEFIDHQPVKGRKILVIAQIGDRLDRDIRDSVAPIAGHFDHYVCRNYHIYRGRAPEVIPALLKDTLVSAGVAETAISIVIDPNEAVRYGLAIAQPGDLLVILVDDHEIATLWQVLSDLAAEQAS